MTIPTPVRTGSGSKGRRAASMKSALPASQPPVGDPLGGRDLDRTLNRFASRRKVVAALCLYQRFCFRHESQSIGAGCAPLTTIWSGASRSVNNIAFKHFQRALGAINPSKPRK